MKLLTELELQNLPTKRLLALFKKVRRELKKRGTLYGHDAKYNSETIDMAFYKMTVKDILDTREDIN